MGNSRNELKRCGSAVAGTTIIETVGLLMVVIREVHTAGLCQICGLGEEAMVGNLVVDSRISGTFSECFHSCI